MKKIFLPVILFLSLFIGVSASAASEDIFWSALDYYGNPLTTDIDTKHIRLQTGGYNNSDTSNFSFSDSYRQVAKTTFSSPINGMKAIFSVAMPYSDALMPNAYPTISISGGTLPSSRITRTDTLYGLTVANTFNESDILRFRLAFYVVDFTNYYDKDITWFNIGYIGTAPNASWNADSFMWYVNYNLLSFSLLRGDTDTSSLLEQIVDKLWLLNTFENTSMEHLHSIDMMLRNYYSVTPVQQSQIDQFNDKYSTAESSAQDAISQAQNFLTPDVDTIDPFDYVDGANFSGISALIGTIVQNGFIVKMFLIVLSCALLGYILHGKKG